MRYAVRGDVAEKSTGRCQPARSAPTEGELFSPVKKSMISQRDQVVQRNASREVSITGNLQGITGNIREFSTLHDSDLARGRESDGMKDSSRQRRIPRCPSLPTLSRQRSHEAKRNAPRDDCRGALAVLLFPNSHAYAREVKSNGGTLLCHHACMGLSTKAWERAEIASERPADTRQDQFKPAWTQSIRFRKSRSAPSVHSTMRELILAFIIMCSSLRSMVSFGDTSPSCVLMADCEHESAGHKN